MNPKEFDWSEDQQVTVVNPTKSDFKFQVHSKEYMVGAGRMAKMPGYIAWMYVYKLATKMAIDAGDFLHWNEEGFRKTYYDKLIAGTDEVVKMVAVEPQIETFDTDENTATDVKPMKARNGQSSKV